MNISLILLIVFAVSAGFLTGIVVARWAVSDLRDKARRAIRFREEAEEVLCVWYVQVFYMQDKLWGLVQENADLVRRIVDINRRLSLDLNVQDNTIVGDNKFEPEGHPCPIVQPLRGWYADVPSELERERREET